MSKPILEQLNLVAADIEASLAFYRRLGIELPEASILRTDSGAHHANAVRRAQAQSANLDIDSVPFARRWNRGWAEAPSIAGRVVLGFRLDSRSAVDELHDSMTQAGYVSLQAPYDAFWGARYAVIEDPDGIAVGLMSPIDNARKSDPPAL